VGCRPGPTSRSSISRSRRALSQQGHDEGLAQYLSGARLGYRLDPSRAVAHGGQMKVDDYYDSALSFVEYLVDRHRQSAMNDLLKYAGETGNIDHAFRRACHQGYEETRQEWLKQLR
jgi:hypothetical protein